MKKALLIGGSGTISAAVTRLVATSAEWELYLFNRGRRKDFDIPAGVHIISGDIHDKEGSSAALKGMEFDCVCEFIAFKPEDVERDWRLFRGRTGQYIFISSASAYCKPAESRILTEDTPLANPYWKYSRNKAACEEFLMEKFREEGFPVTIIRPSHTYDERKLPTGVHGRIGSWQVAQRMREGKPVIVHGDGSSLWTLTHNSDFAKGFVGLMGNNAAIGEAFHITSDDARSWNDIYRAIADALGVEYRPYYVSSQFLCSTNVYEDMEGNLFGDKAVSAVFDNSKLKSLVPDFKCTTGYREGIAQTVSYILSHPEYQLADPEFDHWCDRVIETLDRAAREAYQAVFRKRAV